MNIQQAREYGRSHLEPASSPDLDARLLLQHLLQVGHSYLIAHSEQQLTAGQEQAYRALIARAQKGEPIPYLVGKAPFWGLEFIVSPAVLIPRPETEQLLEAAIGWVASRPSLRAVDVGTGSGCIALCLALELPQTRVEAVDISPAALEIARQNAAIHLPDQIHFHQGDLLQPIQPPLDLIIANLPYVTGGEWTMLDDGVKLYEPEIALKGGDDGLDLIRRLLRQAESKLNPGGAIFLEIGWRQGPATRQIAQAIFPVAQVELLPDYAGHDRIVTIKTG